MASLHHPHIVHVFDFDVTDDGVPYLAMELAEGRDLRTLSGQLQAMTPLQAAQIICQIAGALGAAHAHGVVHRDLKPENVVLVPMSDGSLCAKVVDFGVSKARDLPRITVEPALIGTPEFMAPEQAQGQSDLIDHRTDQFALGILTFFMFTGREPFRGASPVAVLYQVVHEEAPALRKFVSWPCRRVDAVVRRAMAKDPERRFPSIQEFGRALEEAVGADLGLDARERRSTPVSPCFAEETLASVAERQASRKRRGRSAGGGTGGVPRRSPAPADGSVLHGRGMCRDPPAGRERRPRLGGVTPPGRHHLPPDRRRRDADHGQGEGGRAAGDLDVDGDRLGRGALSAVPTPAAPARA